MPEEILETPQPTEPKPTNWPKLVLAAVFGFALLAGACYIGYWYNTQRTSSVGEIPESKRLVVLRAKGNTLYSIDPFTKQEKKLFQIDSGATVNEARVSPDGHKLYYISSKLPDRPGSVVIINNKREKKEFDLVKSEPWVLSRPGALAEGWGQSCFWSPDGNRLACMLNEMESSAGVGANRDKIVILDYASGGVSEIFNSEQIGPILGPASQPTFAGWVGNNKLLYIQTKENIIDIEPADFYTVDTETKAVKKEFSYPYDIGFGIATSLREVFFQSFSRVAEDKFVKYDLEFGQDTILASTKDVLGTTHPIISEDGSKLVFTTYALLKSPEEIAKLKPEELEGVGSTEIHVYDLVTNSKEIIRMAEAIGYVEALLPDNKTFVVNKTPEGSVLFDSETSNFEKLNSSFIGFGYF